MPETTPLPAQLAVTMGDPAGIGPEVILKALADPEVVRHCEITVFGQRVLLRQAYQRLRSQYPAIPLVDPANLMVIEVGEPALANQVVVGVGNAASGELSFRYLEAAIAHTVAGKAHAIVTAPIAKSAWKAAGHHYPGQTERLAEMAGVKQFGMLFVARSPYTGWTLRTLLATTHMPLRQVADHLNPDLLTAKLDLLVKSLQKDFSVTQPRIAIAGLNPHSGEQGQLGQEEQDWLIPWLEQTRSRLPHIRLEGPVPPDTLWVKPGQAWFGTLPFAPPTHPPTSLTSPPADAYLALYHDQGLIPVKLMAFDRAVNTSIGLPFVRTSPDHGTAFDIAGQGYANAASMKAALQLAIELSQQRRHNA